MHLEVSSNQILVYLLLPSSCNEMCKSCANGNEDWKQFLSAKSQLEDMHRKKQMKRDGLHAKIEVFNWKMTDW